MYRTIVVDPPWPSKRAWGGKKARKSASDVYPLMSMEEIMAMKIGDLIHPEGSHLWLWCTQSPAKEDGRLIWEWAPEVVRAWGFDPKCVITWCKNEVGIGAHFQVDTELLVYATARSQDGKVPMTKRDGKARRTYFMASRGAHSEKPAEAYELIERVSSGPFIDIFARRARPGWDVWGNQAPDAVNLNLI